MAKVMIAEDDLMMADMLEEVLVEGGYEVCGIARTVENAVELGERCQPDLAVLDFRLAGGGLGTEVATRLNRRGKLGVLYATGNVSHAGLTRADGEAFLRKPYRPEDVVRALKIVEQIIRTGEASRPFPRGFEILDASSDTPALASPAEIELDRQIKRLRRQQAELANFGRFALGERDLGKVLTEAARVCAQSLEVPFCKVCRYRPEHNDLLVEAGVGWKPGVIGRVVSRADESSPQGRAFITGKPVICTDLNSDATFMLPSFYAEHGVISTVDVIIRKEGKPYGVLEIDSPVRHEYGIHDIDFLTGFANVLAEAVDTWERNDALQSAVDRLRDMVADRDRLLAAKNIILDEKNRLIDEKSILARELQHRVRNNLQLVYGMLSKQAQAATDGAGVDGINAIARRVMALAQVYDHLLGTGLSRTIDFGNYLSSLCANFEALQNDDRPEIGLTCQCAPVMLDLDTVTALGLVVSELIANSYAHAFPHGTGSISVSLSPGQSRKDATILFADDGVGFAETGLSVRHGLQLVRRLMEQVGGAAVVRTDHGTEWTLTFPTPTGVSVADILEA
jgi:two-component sensor histidine kinase/DNA-binding response OmpR family regulator/putative methionine-R-sulfoxide reductase with GAF domain